MNGAVTNSCCMMGQLPQISSSNSTAPKTADTVLIVHTFYNAYAVYTVHIDITT